MVFQNYRAVAAHDGDENVTYGLKLRKVSAAEIKSRAGAVLDKVKLTGFGDRYPGQLSGGQQQRVALARALVLNPQMLLLDEPLSNLDAKIRMQVRAEIRKLQKELGITAVYVTHDQEEALAMSDRIAVFNLGRVRRSGPPKELYERPANRFVADFIGINNLVDGTVRRSTGPREPARHDRARRDSGDTRRTPARRRPLCASASVRRTSRSTHPSGDGSNYFKGRIVFQRVSRQHAAL